MQTLITVLHVLAAIAVVVLVLLQHGKGADMGAAFGSGSAGSLFGSAGASSFLSRSTAFLAAVFFATSLTLTYFSTVAGRSSSVASKVEASRKADAPKGVEPPVAPASSASTPPAVPETKSQEIPK